VWVDEKLRGRRDTRSESDAKNTSRFHLMDILSKNIKFTTVCYITHIPASLTIGEALSSIGPIKNWSFTRSLPRAQTTLQFLEENIMTSISSFSILIWFGTLGLLSIWMWLSNFWQTVNSLIKRHFSCHSMKFWEIFSHSLGMNFARSVSEISWSMEK
jgi:hypothetical protein